MTKRMSPPRNPIRWLRNALTNLDAPFPLSRKVYLLSRNVAARAVNQSACCGHPGEPGC